MFTDEMRDRIIKQAIKNHITTDDPNVHEVVYSMAMQVIDLTLIQVIRNIMDEEEK